MKIVENTFKLGICLALLQGCRNGQAADPKPGPISVKAIQLSADKAGNSGQYLYNGTLAAQTTVELSFQVQGTIIELPFKTGDHVEKGQLVAAIDPATYQSQYNAQLAQAKLAEENYNRINAVFQKGSIAEIRMLEARSNYEQSSAAAKAAYQNVVHTRIYAPVSGYVGEKKAEAGAIASPGQAVIQLLDTRALDVLVAVSEKEINWYKVGTDAVVTLDAFPGKELKGRVHEVAVSALSGNASYTVKIRLNNSEEVLKPGMLCKVKFLPKERVYPDVAKILVPVESVRVDEKGDNYVYIVTDHKAKRKKVTTGALFGDKIAITAGLDGSEWLVTSGYQKISDETPVSIN